MKRPPLRIAEQAHLIPCLRGPRESLAGFGSGIVGALELELELELELGGFGSERFEDEDDDEFEFDVSCRSFAKNRRIIPSDPLVFPHHPCLRSRGYAEGLVCTYFSGFPIRNPPIRASVWTQSASAGLMVWWFPIRNPQSAIEGARRSAAHVEELLELIRRSHQEDLASDPGNRATEEVA
jgi:hypothetical protein